MPENPRILTVDDDASMGKVLGALLSQADLAPRHVSAGKEALAALESSLFDLVITDLRMPGMDGMALLAEVARRWPDVPVIVLTAHGTVPLAVEAMKVGATDFMLKPFDREELLFVVRKALACTKRNADGIPAAEAPIHHEFVGD